MFTIYHSNQLDVLKTITSCIISDRPLRDPFQPEVILVQSTGMGQWIQMELATHFGIAANIKCPLPASFIWQMFTRVLTDIPDKRVFSKPVMTWRLMALLPSLYQNPDFSAISHYLRDDGDKRTGFQFAARVADLFEQYLMYRPDWLESWWNDELIDGVGDAQRWQAPLWRALMAETKQAEQPLWHPTNLYQDFIHTLSQSQIRPPGLPDRIFICGISALPPTYLQALQALGRHIDIHLLLTNPCRYYWGDILDCAFHARLLQRRRRHYQQQKELSLFRYPKKAAALLDKLQVQKTENPLLTSWGKQGRDNLNLLAQMDGIEEVDAFIEPAGDNLLSLIQHDILNLEDHSMGGRESEILKQSGSKRPLRLDDRSLSLHICHSQQREVEVLHDSLLAMIDEDPTLRPRDVIVMVPNIDCYTPAIRAVFSNTCGKPYLPFAISDSRVRMFHPALTAFLKLLELPYSRFTAEQGLELLEVPALAGRFGIDEQGLQLLRQWVAESGIRWGLDDETLHKLMLPATGQHTWQFGLTRMLLGYAMDTENDDWQGILPYDESCGLIASLVGKLAELLMRLRQWRDRLIQPRSLNDWIGFAHEIIEDFFVPDTDAEAELILLKHQWQQMLQCGLTVGYTQAVPVTLLQDELAARLDQERVSQSFLTGSINFCTMVSMRSIPFRVVCLLGINDGVYPRIMPEAGFDLMAKQPQCGDRSRRDDDRYLFLEALLSAKQRLYISFIGRSIQDNRPNYPSSLVRELSDYISESFYLPGDEHADAQSSTDRVRAHLWQWHTRMPFSPENFLPGNESQSYADEWLPAARAEGEPQPNFVATLSTPQYEALALDELLSFYRHPVSAWFVQRLAISLEQTSLELTDHEPFVIDGLMRYQLNNRLLNTLIYGENTDRLFRQVRAAGLLPYGAFGKLYWAQQSQEMSALSAHVRKWLLPETESYEIRLTLNHLTLSGWLPRVQANGLLRWRPGKLSARDGLLLWVEHLAYCAMGGEGESRMFGTSGAWHFSPLPPCQAKAFLVSLVSGYYQGMASPLLLLPRAGGAWIHHCYDPATQSIDREERRQRLARDKLIHAWKGNIHVPGEAQDAYLQLLIRQLEEQHIDAIISAAERYFLPPFMFNVAKREPAKRYKKN